MIGRIICIRNEASINHFIILDKILVRDGGCSITVYLCQLKQIDGLGRIVMAYPNDIYFPFIPKEVVL
jgi:hypothetical protein